MASISTPFPVDVELIPKMVFSVNAAVVHRNKKPGRSLIGWASASPWGWRSVS